MHKRSKKIKDIQWSGNNGYICGYGKNLVSLKLNLKREEVPL